MSSLGDYRLIIQKVVLEYSTLVTLYRLFSVPISLSFTKL